MVRTDTVWFTRNPTWIDEFNFQIHSERDSIKVFVHEERKKGSQKKIGEVKMLLDSIAQNEKVEKWHPIIGSKGVTVGDIRIRFCYAVDILLPTTAYRPLIDLIQSNDMHVIKVFSDVCREKSVVAMALLNIFGFHNRAEYLIQNFIDYELENTKSAEVLFRSNSICSKLIDGMMKTSGERYLKAVLLPAVEVFMRETKSVEIQEERLKEEDDYVVNLEKLKVYGNLTLQTILRSAGVCPMGMRKVFKYLYEKTPTYLNNESGNVQDLAITSFIFLRFFVPALMNPKASNLTTIIPDENQSRLCTLIASIMQKVANFTLFRNHDLYFSRLNGFLDEQKEKIRKFIKSLIDIPDGAAPFYSPQGHIDGHVAILVRHIEMYRQKLDSLVDKDPLIRKLFEVIDDLTLATENEKEKLGLSSSRRSIVYQDIDRLVSDVIGKEMPKGTHKKLETLKEPKNQVKKARSSSFVARGYDRLKNLIPGRKRKNSRSIKFMDETIDSPISLPVNSQVETPKVSENIKATTSQEVIQPPPEKELERHSDSNVEKVQNSDHTVSENSMEPQEEQPLESETAINNSTEEIDDVNLELERKILAEMRLDNLDDETTDEIEYYEMGYNVDSLKGTIEEFDKIIRDINMVKVPPMNMKPIEEAVEFIPELQELDKIIAKLDETITITTPKLVMSTHKIICHYCLDPIESGSEYLILNDKSYHEHHLKCKICGKDIGDVAFQSFNNNEYCLDCFARSYGNFPTCSHCEKPILTSSYTRALNKNWHIEHFLCTICHAPFDDGTYYNVDNKPYCEKHRSGTEEGGPVCQYCSQSIKDEDYLEFYNQYFHADHFLCDICQTPLGGSIILIERNGKELKVCESHA